MADSNEQAARADFHVALALLILPLVSLPMSWWLALRHRGSLYSEKPAERRWVRRLAALVAFDTGWSLLIVVGISTGVIPRALADRRAERVGLRLGVTLDPEGHDGLKVTTVLPHGPAERAGLRPGDRIIEAVADHQPIAGAEALLTELAGSTGGPLQLGVERAGGKLSLELVPEAAKVAPEERLPGPRPPEWGLIALALAAIAGMAARRRARGWLLAPSAVGVAIGLHQSVGVLVRARSAGGVPDGTYLVAVAGGAAVLLAAALGVRALLVRTAVLTDGGPPRDVFITALRGLFYAYGLGWRSALALFGILMLIHVSPETHSPLPLLRTLDRGQGLLFVGTTVVLAPVAEELLFRGVLLGWMRGWAGPRWALLASTAVFGLLHLPYGWGAVPITVYGAALGWTYLRSGGLGAPILLHTAINGLATLLAVASVR